MKISTSARLFFGLAIAVFIFASSSRASLEEVLAPLPLMNVEVAKTGSLEVNKESSSLDEPAPKREARFTGIETVDIHLALEEALEQSLRPNGDLSIVPLRDLPDLSAYAQPFTVSLMDLPGRLTRGNTLLRFQIENENGVLGEWSIPARVHLFTDVWFPRKNVRRGELASASDFEIGQVDLLAEPDAVPATMEALLRHEYSRDLSPGRALAWKDLAPRALVRKGNLVEVNAVQGLLAITMRAIARQDGSEGDIILLRNPDSAKEFAARVTGENRAEVAF